jgi:hypothetical protein
MEVNYEHRDTAIPGAKTILAYFHYACEEQQPYTGVGIQVRLKETAFHGVLLGCSSRIDPVDERETPERHRGFDRSVSHEASS